MARQRSQYSREFKLEAVRLITERGVSFVQASRALDVHQTVLRDGVRALAADPKDVIASQGQRKPEQAELLTEALTMALW